MAVKFKVSKKPKVLEKPPKDKEVVQYTDLRQVMDYKRDFKMFYSGVEYEVYLDGCYNMGIRDFLMSYEYLKTKGAGQLRKYKDMHLFIDSGAYTYMNDPKYKDYTIEQWEDQIREYLKWAEKHKDSIFGMAELDLHYLVGLEKVNEWRRKFFEPFMLRTGVPVCFIYHNEGLDLWEAMCQRYPYVGFSAVSDSGDTRKLEDYQNLLRFAEKHNALVHGFGMTRTSLLPKLPFYTVDSTSWKAGFRYGLLSIWNGTKVQQFKKEEWELKALPFTRNYPDITFDEDLLRDFNEPEILRASVYAYMRAEEYITERLRPLMYWKRAVAIKVDVDNLPEDFFPPLDWFENPDSKYREYAEKMNINPENELQVVKDCILDMMYFVNYRSGAYEELNEEYTEEVISGIHDIFINRIVPDHDTKIEDLIQFYTSCLKGDNDTLLHLGTNFDRIVKERDSYIEEDEFEEVEVDLKELDALQLQLTGDCEEYPEIAELDREIFSKTGVTVHRNEKGQLIKGTSLRRLHKKVYSKKYPKYACDTCYSAQKCPEFKAGFVCAFNKMFNRFDSRNMADIIDGMQGILDHNMARMQRAMMMEVMSGSVADQTVTNLMTQNLGIMNQMKQMYEYAGSEVLKQTHVIKADGSQEKSTIIQNPQSGGILEKLFSTPSKDAPEEVNLDIEEAVVIEVEPEVKNTTVYSDNEN